MEYEKEKLALLSSLPSTLHCNREPVATATLTSLSPIIPVTNRVIENRLKILLKQKSGASTLCKEYAERLDKFLHGLAFKHPKEKIAQLAFPGLSKEDLDVFGAKVGREQFLLKHSGRNVVVVKNNEQNQKELQLREIQPVATGAASASSSSAAAPVRNTIYKNAATTSSSDIYFFGPASSAPNGAGKEVEDEKMDLCANDLKVKHIDKLSTIILGAASPAKRQQPMDVDEESKDVNSEMAVEAPPLDVEQHHNNNDPANEELRSGATDDGICLDFFAIFHEKNC
ncbi:unnamed protein product [Amoebophrya sp. A120]|nr:unnamed protein product [Amoebophrya sp. A120]|eukprot:GSA120T00025546001.1